MKAAELRRGMLVKAEPGNAVWLKNDELYIIPDVTTPFLQLHTTHDELLSPYLIYVGKKREKVRKKNKILRMFLADGRVVKLVNCNARKLSPVN